MTRMFAILLLPIQAHISSFTVIHWQIEFMFLFYSSHTHTHTYTHTHICAYTMHIALSLCTRCIEARKWSFHFLSNFCFALVVFCFVFFALVGSPLVIGRNYLVIHFVATMFNKNNNNNLFLCICILIYSRWASNNYIKLMQTTRNCN